MKFVFICFLLFTSCIHKAPRLQLSESLDTVKCEAGEFRGLGMGNNREEALSTAYSDLAKQIYSSVIVSTKYLQKQVLNGKENISSEYESELIVKSALLNAHDARILHTERGANKTGAVLCMSRADAAKGFTKQQQLAADSLALVSHIVANVENPKRKNEAWHKTQIFWNEIMRIQNLLEGWGLEKANYFDSASEAYLKARENYKNYCQNANFFWEPEQENDYSAIAFSILSKNLKIEKSACSTSGVLLNYKGNKPDCARKFGVHSCSYQPLLSIASCQGAEYLLLKNSIENAHQKQEFALEKMQENFRTADFWKEWEQEIREWSLQCE
ncbi:MAG: LPP20 family lipoprotein [Fibromonadaceae bacterium]|jgi:hypothetical protein|nr:LPP20 family lipoprotein [Fibromonadaceae bacterium]